MGHPLSPDLSKLSNEEVAKKYGDLMNRMGAAYRMGSSEMVFQLQMLIDDYQTELGTRNRKALEEMESTSKKFTNIIDIK